jgi:hypothetical protein
MTRSWIHFTRGRFVRQARAGLGELREEHLGREYRRREGRPIFVQAQCSRHPPIMSDRVHLAPSSWVTFEGVGFVVLSFLPQIAVADLNAEELPSYHRNIDMDEVMHPCR